MTRSQVFELGTNTEIQDKMAETATPAPGPDNKFSGGFGRGGGQFSRLLFWLVAVCAVSVISRPEK